MIITLVNWINKSKSLARQNLLLFSLIFLLLFDIARAQTTNDTLNIFSGQNRLQFGNYLFCDNDYIRAIDEFRVYLRTGDSDTVRFKIGFALSKLHKYQEAEEDFKELISVPLLSEKAKLEIYKTKFFSGDFQNFQEMFSSANNLPPEYFSEISRLSNIIYLMQGNELPDSISFKDVFEEKFRKSMMGFYSRKNDPGFKSPVKAALLSALLPGLGKVYTTQYTDGLTSLLFTGVLSFLAYDNFNANHTARGWIFASLAGVFYTGNIYGSAASAQIYNTQIKLNFNLELNTFLENNNYFLPDWDFLCP